MFAFDLAKELRWVDVDAMLTSIPLPLFYEWAEYANRKPFGEERADLRIGYGLAQFASMWAKGLKPRDFMPTFGRRAEGSRQTPAQMHAILKGMVDLGKQKTAQIAAKKAPKTP